MIYFILAILVFGAPVRSAPTLTPGTENVSWSEDVEQSRSKGTFYQPREAIPFPTTMQDAPRLTITSASRSSVEALQDALPPNPDQVTREVKTSKGRSSTVYADDLPVVPELIRARRSSLEPQMSSQNLLVHKSQLDVNGHNYPKDFGFDDYIPSAKVKRLDYDPSDVVVLAQDTPPQNKKLPIRRRLSKLKYNKIMKLFGNASLYSQAIDKNNVETRLDVVRANLPEQFASSNESSMSADSSRQFSSGDDMWRHMNIDGILGVTNMTNVNVTPNKKSPQAFKTNTPERKGVREISSGSSDGQTVSKISKRKSESSGSLSNMTVDKGDGSNSFKHDGKDDIYRGTIVDTRRYADINEGMESVVHPVFVDVKDLTPSAGKEGWKEESEGSHYDLADVKQQLSSTPKDGVNIYEWFYEHDKKENEVSSSEESSEHMAAQEGTNDDVDTVTKSHSAQEERENQSLHEERSRNEPQGLDMQPNIYRGSTVYASRYSNPTLIDIKNENNKARDNFYDKMFGDIYSEPPAVFSSNRDDTLEDILENMILKPPTESNKQPVLDVMYTDMAQNVKEGDHNNAEVDGKYVKVSESASTKTEGSNDQGDKVEATNIMATRLQMAEEPFVFFPSQSDVDDSEETGRGFDVHEDTALGLGADVFSEEESRMYPPGQYRTTARRGRGHVFRGRRRPARRFNKSNIELRKESNYLFPIIYKGNISKMDILGEPDLSQTAGPPYISL